MKHILPLLVLCCSLQIVLAGPVPFDPADALVATGSTIGQNPNWGPDSGSGDYIYLGTYEGNDSVEKIEAILAWLSGNPAPYPGIPAGALSPATDLIRHDIAAGGTELTGTWSFDGGGDVHYLVLKGADYFALYALVAPYDPDHEYKFSTADLKTGSGQQPGLSHFSVYTSVPEPASLLLLGAGLVGLGLLGRKRR